MKPLIITMLLMLWNSPTFAEPKLTLKQLKNTVYSVDEVQNFKLVGGVYFHHPFPENPKETWKIALLDDKVAFGDLNKDGLEDAATVLHTWAEGSGVFYDLCLLLNNNGNPQFVDFTSLGDRVMIHSLNIEDGKVVLDMTTHGPKDPLCCPTLKKSVKYKLSANKIKKL